MTSKIKVLAYGAAVASGLFGCAGDPPIPAKAPPPVAVQTPPRAATPSIANRPVNVSDDIRAMCNLPNPKEAPKFDFDGAELTSSDREVLQGLAKCMTDGALKGKGVRLVGHADVRGEQEYNMALGAKRAANVKGFLSNLGVAENRLLETSRGELDAKGTDEDTMAFDRRVDIEAASK